MTDPHGELDDWLQAEVTPLYPQQGSFERIRQRARARKQRQVALAVAGCVVVAAAVVAAPQIGTLLHGGSGHKRPPLALRQQTPTTQITSPGSPSPVASSDAKHAEQIHQHTSLGHSTTSPPPDFQPTSVTVVGTGTGGYLSAVIGQAGTPGHCATRYCTSLAGISNFQTPWYGVSAPVAPGAGQVNGVSQLRFANAKDGWAYGPALYETTGGGSSWSRVPTDGERITDLETVGKTAFAVFATCGPGAAGGAGFAAGCVSFWLYTGTAGATTWKEVHVPAGYAPMTVDKSSSAALVISGGTTGYLLTPEGALLRGSVSGGPWTLAGRTPVGCLPGPALANGQPSDAQLAAGTNKLLVACDTTTGGKQETVLYSSADGATWTKLGTVPHTGAATSLTTSSSGQVVLATTTGIYYSATGTGTTWQSNTFGGAGPPRAGFSYVGLTTSTLGVAVPADARLGEIYLTNDGGQTWLPSAING